MIKTRSKIATKNNSIVTVLIGSDWLYC